MFNSENSKFKVGDSVVLRNSQYRGNWLGYNLAGGNEIEYVGDDTFVHRKQLLPEFWKEKKIPLMVGVKNIIMKFLVILVAGSGKTF